MRSFRLDKESARRFARRWPWTFLGVAIAIALGYLGWADALVRLVFVHVGGAVLAGYARGTLAERLRKQHPGARFIGLLAFGMSVLLLTVIVDLTYPEIEGEVNVLAIGPPIAFVSILAFVLINRKNKSVVR